MSFIIDIIAEMLHNFQHENINTKGLDNKNSVEDVQFKKCSTHTWYFRSWVVENVEAAVWNSSSLNCKF